MPVRTAPGAARRPERDRGLRTWRGIVYSVVSDTTVISASALSRQASALVASAPSHPDWPAPPDRLVQLGIAVCFFFSGAAGLVYEVLWAKHLSLFIGSTGLCHTIILASFMGGLALGSWFIGRIADQISHPLRLYAVLELGIGCYGIFYPSLGLVVEWLYFRLAEEVGFGGGGGLVLKLVLSGALLIPPTFLMGGTLPLLGRFLAGGRHNAARAVSLLYFLNSFGAVAGTLIAGFYMISQVGLRLSTITAGGINLMVSLLAILCSLRGEPETDEPPASEERSRRAKQEHQPLGARDRSLLWGIAASGFVGMVLELAWVRYFTQILGSSSHSFTLMLAAFISGITLGGLVAARFLPRVRDLRLFFALTQLGMGVAVLLPLAAYERFPYWFWWVSSLLQRSDDAYQVHLIGKYFFVFVVMFVPTIFAGMSLPAVTAQLSRRGRVGAQIGVVYACNTLGTVAGALSAGLLLLGLLGIQWTLKTAILLNLGIAATVILGHEVKRIRAIAAGSGGRGRQCILFGSAAAALVALFLPSWDPRLLTFGVFRRNDQPPPNFTAYREGLERYDVAYCEEGTDARVMVVKSPDGIVSLVTNGKADASNGTDMSTQMLIGHVPMLFHPNPRDVLVVGLGSGVTAASVLTHHPGTSVDCVEILPEVKEAARWFAPWNNQVLDNPELNLVIDDARSFIRTSGRRYDVIVSEPPNPWMAGVGNLFAREFYKDCLVHLRGDGLMVQFFHAYEMSDDLVQVMARTFIESFPHVYTFNTGSAQADFIFLGSRTPLNVDFRRFRERFEAPDVRRDLARIGLRSPSALLLLQSHSPGNLVRFTGHGRINTDDVPIFESEGPRAFFTTRKSDALTHIDERRGAGEKLLLRQYFKEFPPTSVELRDLAEVFRSGVVENASLLGASLREYLVKVPGDVDAWLILGEELLRAGRPHAALAVFDEALGEVGGHPKGKVKLLRAQIAALRPIEKEELTVLSTGGSFPRSKKALKQCLELDPGHQDLYCVEMAKLSIFEGDRSGVGYWVSRAISHRQDKPQQASPEITKDEIDRLKRWATEK